MRKLKNILLFLFILSFGAEEVGARHLVGGNIGYEYISTLGNGEKRYRVYLYIYRDCWGSGAQYDRPLYLGVYHNDANKSLWKEIRINPKFIRSVRPPNVGVNCPFSPSVCLEEGFYETFIDLPADTLGYHLLYERCCRNNAVLNLLNGTGQSYYGFIPNTNLNNTSPVFNDIPIPYMCITDLVRVDNSATDVDGDSLVYRFVHPYSGGSTGAPRPRPGPVMANLGLAVYSAGYNILRPFGNGGVNRIDRFTGLTEYLSNIQGNFVVAIDVEEWRNGIRISSTRRDIQVLTISCPPNPIPLLDTVTYNSGVNHIVEAGDSLFFPIKLVDSDSMVITVNGSIFSPASGIPNPRPSITKPTNKDSIVSWFTWQTSCLHASNTPYKFTLTVEDKGCPRKFAYYDFSIKVTFPKYADSIKGPDLFCPGDTAVYYHNGKTKSSYLWKVFNGLVLGSQNSDSVVVIWSSTPGAGGLIELREISEFGCVANPIRKNVQVLSIPLANAGSPRAMCSGDTIIIGKTNDPTYKYKWDPPIFLSNDTISSPVFHYLNNGGMDTLIRYIVEVDYNFVQCVNYTRTDTVDVTVHPLPYTSVIFGPDEVCEYSNARYLVTEQSRSSYSWGSSGGDSDPRHIDNEIEIYWGAAGTGTLAVLETDSNGCVGKPVFKQITIRKRPKIYGIQGESIICESGLGGLIYEIINPDAKARYNWTIIGGALLNGQGTNRIEVNWRNENDLRLQILETDSFGCQSEEFEKIIQIDRSDVELLRVSTLDDDADKYTIEWSGVLDSIFNGQHSVWYKKPEASNTGWQLIAEVQKGRNYLETHEPDPNSSSWEFKIQGSNYCKDIFESEVHESIFLQGEFSTANNSTSINWNDYSGWLQGIDHYKVFSFENGSQSFLLHTDQNQSRQLDFNVDFDTYSQCYRIRGVELNGNLQYSWSNILCLDYDPVILVPNAFSPGNGDQLNETFEVAGGRIKSFQIQIYNRWGEVLFETDDIRNSWDGKKEGREVPQGLYIFHIRYTNFLDEATKLEGVISVLR